jgi:ABC-2 type transport system permease protein
LDVSSASPLIAVASGISNSGYRLFNDLQSGILERFHSMPIDRTIVRAVGTCAEMSNAISVVIIVLVGLLVAPITSAATS